MTHKIRFGVWESRAGDVLGRKRLVHAVRPEKCLAEIPENLASTARLGLGIPDPRGNTSWSITALRLADNDKVIDDARSFGYPVVLVCARLAWVVEPSPNLGLYLVAEVIDNHHGSRFNGIAFCRVAYRVFSNPNRDRGVVDWGAVARNDRRGWARIGAVKQDTLAATAWTILRGELAVAQNDLSVPSQQVHAENP
jgi:hypothetical protein